MDLKIQGQNFIVGGAGAGFGRAIAEALANEGAQVLAVSLTEEKLRSLKQGYPANIDYIAGDITTAITQDSILERLEGKVISGIVINAGGPPAGRFEDISLEQWDAAWQKIVKWKIDFVRLLLPRLKAQGYGKLLFIESVSVKQAVPNLMLSNALRPAVVGFAKTLSSEVAKYGINVNILAPGYHATDAMVRLFKKKSELEGISIEEAKKAFEMEIPIGGMGKPQELAGLAVWLLSPLSRFVTGQTISHDGGAVKGFFG